jgi:hypothetical protein
MRHVPQFCYTIDLRPPLSTANCRRVALRQPFTAGSGRARTVQAARQPAAGAAAHGGSSSNACHKSHAHPPQLLHRLCSRAAAALRSRRATPACGCKLRLQAHMPRRCCAGRDAATLRRCDAAAAAALRRWAWTAPPQPGTRPRASQQRVRHAPRVQSCAPRATPRSPQAAAVLFAAEAPRTAARRARTSLRRCAASSCFRCVRGRHTTGWSAFAPLCIRARRASDGPRTAPGLGRSRRQYVADVQPALLESFTARAPSEVVDAMRQTVANMLGTLPPQARRGRSACGAALVRRRRAAAGGPSAWHTRAPVPLTRAGAPLLLRARPCAPQYFEVTITAVGENLAQVRRPTAASRQASTAPKGAARASPSAALHACTCSPALRRRSMHRRSSCTAC